MGDSSQIRTSRPLILVSLPLVACASFLVVISLLPRVVLCAWTGTMAVKWGLVWLAQFSTFTTLLSGTKAKKKAAWMMNCPLSTYPKDLEAFLLMV